MDSHTLVALLVFKALQHKEPSDRNHWEGFLPPRVQQVVETSSTQVLAVKEGHGNKWQEGREGDQTCREGWRRAEGVDCPWRPLQGLLSSWPAKRPASASIQLVKLDKTGWVSGGSPSWRVLRGSRHQVRPWQVKDHPVSLNLGSAGAQDWGVGEAIRLWFPAQSQPQGDTAVWCLSASVRKV